jgi:hypothetical protein
MDAINDLPVIEIMNTLCTHRLFRVGGSTFLPLRKRVPLGGRGEISLPLT